MQAELTRRFDKVANDVLTLLPSAVENAQSQQHEQITYDLALNILENSWTFAALNGDGNNGNDDDKSLYAVIGNRTYTRDRIGRFAATAGHAVVSGVVPAIIKAGAKVGHIEHAAKEWVRDGIVHAVSKLPGPMQKAATATYYVTRAGTQAAFVSWTVGQKLAERVSKERGASDEESRRLRGVLSSLDVALLKPVQLGLHTTGLGAGGLGIASMVPPATAGYLLYSTAKDPRATYRAAKGLVKDATSHAIQSAKSVKTGFGSRVASWWSSVVGVGQKKGTYYTKGKLRTNVPVATVPVGNSDKDNAGLIANLIFDQNSNSKTPRTAPLPNDVLDWRCAVFAAALQQTQDGASAIVLATRVLSENPTPPNLVGNTDKTTGQNCGIGEGGFQKGNTCAKDGGTGHADYGSHVKIGELTGKPIAEDAHRFNRTGLKAAGDVFWSREKDYAEAFGETVGGSGSIIAGKVKLKNPLHVEATQRQFSDPSFENPIIKKAKEHGHDGVIFDQKENGDRFYVAFGGSVTGNSNFDQNLVANVADTVRDWLRYTLSSREGPCGESLWRKYTRQGYMKGVHNAYQRSAPQKVGESVDHYNGRREQFIANIESNSLTTNSAVALDQIQGITGEMGAILIKIVERGVKNGTKPETVANQLRKQLEISKQKALAIARTEMVRVHAEGQLDTMESLGVEQIMANVEYHTTGQPCKKCAPLAGKVFTVNSARGLIPRHTHCRCEWAPAPGQRATGRSWYAGKRDVSRSQIDNQNFDQNFVVANDKSGGQGKFSHLTGGRWITTDSGHHVYIKGGRVVAGNPHVMKAINTHMEKRDAKVQSQQSVNPVTPQQKKSSAVSALHRHILTTRFHTKQHTIENPKKKEQSHGGRSDSGRGKPTQERPTSTSGQVAGHPTRSGDTPADRSGGSDGGPTGKTSPQGFPTKVVAKAVERQPAHVDEVRKKIDRFESFFRSKGEHQVADWLGHLRNHVEGNGVEATLAAVGGVGTGKHTKKSVEYEGGWDKDAFDHGDHGRHLAQFCESYLNRHGITMSHQTDRIDPSSPQPLVSSASPKYGGTEAKDVHPRRKGSFTVSDPTLRDKLEESKRLPGLETSEDVSKVAGKKVTHLTPDVTAKFDSIYGKDKWIVKAYGDDAAAGYGIYFPQRARQMQGEAQNNIWNAGAGVAKYGFSLHRDESNNVVGLKHTSGDTYLFGTDKYNKTIDGEVRHWGDKAHEAAQHEHGAALAGGGKDYMVQPAFNVVGISEADRAAGVTIKYGQEGRVHVVTRNGKAEVVPYSTWLKGDHLPVVFDNADTRAMAEAARQAVDRLPHSEKHGQIYAPDIVKTTEGYKVVETNPANHTGSSGYLGNNPLIIDSYVSHLTGRTPAHVEFIRKLLTKSSK